MACPPNCFINRTSSFASLSCHGVELLWKVKCYYGLRMMRFMTILGGSDPCYSIQAKQPFSRENVQSPCKC
ncbi:hypothetical protein SLA2020_301140 [Shorea laevis]